MSKLLSQGGFGCVYYPGILCDGRPNLSKKVISKLQKRGVNSENEILIGNIIRKINNYELFFSPVIKSCGVNLANIDRNLLSKCDVVNEKKDNEYILLDILYINSNQFIELIKKMSRKNLIVNIFETYIFLLTSINILLENKIVHFDLKTDNILYKKTTNHPILIDFGISLPMGMITSKNVGEYIYLYAPDYYIWPLDVHILGFLLHKTENKLTKLDAIRIGSEYADNNKSLHVYSDEFKNNFKEFCIKVAEQFIDMEREEVIEKLISNYTTWDNYAISAFYLNTFSFLFENGFYRNKLFIYFSQILLLNISPDANKRMSIDETKIKFSEIFYVNENPEAYFNFVEAFNYSEKIVTKKLREDVKSLNKILITQSKSVGRVLS
jgi:serine/threonine protein kinase